MKTKMYFFLLIFISLSAYCQNNDVKVKVFDGNDVQQETKEVKKAELLDKNLITLNPYLLARGAFVVGYERVLHPKHALGVYAGFTYRDFIYEVFKDEDNPFSDADVKPGYYLDLSYKWYPKSYDNFEGVYLSPGFIRRTYNMSRQVDLNNGYEKVDRGYSMTEGYLKFGYVYESWWFDDLITDFYFGIGYRSIDWEDYTINSTGIFQTAVRQSKSKGVPAVYLGLRVGIPF